MAVFNTCCGYFSLRTGCIIIGGLGLFIEFLLYFTINIPTFRFVIIGAPFSGLLLCGALLKHRICLWISIIGHIILIMLLGIAFVCCTILWTERYENHDYTVVIKDDRASILLILAILIIPLIVALILITLVAHSYTCEMDEVEAHVKAAKTAEPDVDNLVPHPV